MRGKYFTKFNIFFDLILFFGIILGGLTGYSIGKNREKIPKVVRIQAQSSNYKYINPLLAYDIEDNIISSKSKELKRKLNSLVNVYITEGKATNISIYLRSGSSDTIGIGESEQYEPGSLFKVPIMIAYLKQAETQPDILNKKIKFDNIELKSEPQDIPPKKQIEFGKEYTINELIEYMIIYSDNNAANILADRIYIDQKNAYTEMLTDLGLPVDSKTITSKTYSLFLRILRNATYLNREMSEKALSILAEVDFKDGLAAGVPSGIPVVHKFGEFGSYENDILIEQLHDCGIIYYPDHPYLLCIMTRGQKISDLQKVISSISSIVYESLKE